MGLNFETAGVNISYNSKGKETIEEIATPIEICRDMSNLFDYTNCNQKIWMDIACKTGNTLEVLKKHSVNKENIVAICDNKQSQMLVCRKLYGKLLPEIEIEITVKSLEAYKITRRGQIYWVSNWKTSVKDKHQDAYNLIKFVILKEMEKTMSLEFTSEDREFSIDNIIMNPPYNPSDLYIDFVELAHKIASEHVVAITPAKGINGKSDAKNDKFREVIVPYIEKAVLYKDSTDIFNIEEWGGICYYLLTKTKNDKVFVKNVCTKNNILESDYEEHDETKLNLYNRKVLSIIGKVGTLGEGFEQSSYIKNNNRGEETIDNTLGFKRCVFTGEQDRGTDKSATRTIEVMQGDKVVGYRAVSELFTTANLNKYKCICSIMPGAVSAFDKNGQVLGMFKIASIKPNQVPKGSFPVLKYFDTEDECKSFISYMNTKLVSFLYYIGCCGTTLTKEFFRFVPDPVNFDHIFTDEELYKKYDLTEEEIAIIESVIKERN